MLDYVAFDAVNGLVTSTIDRIVVSTPGVAEEFVLGTKSTLLDNRRHPHNLSLSFQAAVAISFLSIREPVV